MNNKTDRYSELIAERKKCRLCEHKGFCNPGKWPQYDTNHIGPWSEWAHGLDAEVMIVGQDFGDKEFFEKVKGKLITDELIEKGEIYATATDKYLRLLSQDLGLDIGPPASPAHNPAVFLTNAVLCMKEPPMNKPIPTAVMNNCGQQFLKPLIDLISPKVILPLGHIPSKAVLKMYQDQLVHEPPLKGSFRAIFESAPYKMLHSEMIIFPLYHPGKLGQANRKQSDNNGKSGLELMREDWKRVYNHLTNGIG